MGQPAGDKTWEDLVETDIMLLKASGIKPQAIIERLWEARERQDQSSHWRNFSACGRGNSYQQLDGTSHAVTLEFRHRVPGLAAYKALTDLRSQFKAIIAVSYREFGTRDNAAVTIRLEPYAPAPQIGAKKNR